MHGDDALVLKHELFSIMDVSVVQARLVHISSLLFGLEIDRIWFRN